MRFNIDKSIDLLKEVNAGTLYFCKDEKYEDYAQAIENVLKELETYKKIAEKLANEVEKLDDVLSEEMGNYTNGYCFIDENSCICNHERKCPDCIIDWARKEVEK